MAYTSVSFVYGEVLTSTKMNILAANDASFHDGSGLEIINKIYPIGAIFISTSLDTAIKVHNALGGTWESWGSGRVPVGVDTEQIEFNTVDKTGGEKTHTLTIDEMPGHSHATGLNITNGYNDSGDTQEGLNTKGWSQAPWTVSKTSTSVGGGEEHNNLQPYITCYMWKRIA